MKRLSFLFLTLFIFSCNAHKGTFAFRSEKDDLYRKRVNSRLEFKKSDDIQWIYKFNSPPAKMKVGLVLMKREAQWVEVFSKLETIDKEKKIIYGEIKNLDEGNYKFVLTDYEDNNEIFASFIFQIYEE